MIQFDGVSLGFGGQVLFEDVNFSLQRGERCGVVGRNGSGKSTLLRLIEGEVEADRGAISVARDYRIGYLQQHIRFTQPTVLEEAALGLAPESLYKVEAILFGLGFGKEDMGAPTSAFSGGYHLRLHLAKVLVAEPDCLLLDEPSNYLDILSLRWLTRFLRRWQGEFLLISHDRDFMDQVTTHTVGIHRQKVRKMRGTTVPFFEQILAEEEVHEKTRVKADKKRAHMRTYIDRFGAKASKAAQAQSKAKMLARVPVLEKLNALSELGFGFREASFPGKKVIEAKGVHFSYTDAPLIEGVSLEVHKGEKIALIGKNGRGKSTLLRLLAGDLEAQEGSVEASSNTRIGYFGQTHVDRLHLDHTIEEEIKLANPELTYGEVKGIAGLMLFGGALSEKKIGVLSGGERSRVLLGKIVAQPCNLLLLDEPTHHLDIESIEALIDALEDFAGAVVMVTHSELILRRLNPYKIVVCSEGKQSVFLGNYDAFLEKVGWEEERKPKKPKKMLQEEIRKKEKELKEAEVAVKEAEGSRWESKMRRKLARVEEELLKLYGAEN